MSIRSCENVQARLMLFAGGDLDEQDSCVISAHLSECDECRRRFVEACACWDRLSLEVRPPRPEFHRQAQEIIQENLDRLFGSPSRGASFRRLTSRPFRTFGTAAAAILVVVSAVWLCQTLDFAGRDAVDRPGDRGRAGLPGTGNHERQAGEYRKGSGARVSVQSIARRAEESFAKARALSRDLGVNGTSLEATLNRLVDSAVLAANCPYLPQATRAEAWYLVYQAYGKAGELEKQRAAFLEYLGLAENLRGRSGKTDIVVAEGTRLSRSGEFARAIEYYRMALDIQNDPGVLCERPEPETCARLLCLIGRSLEKLKDFSRAIEIYRYAATTYPGTEGSVTALLRIPSAYVNIQQVDKAIETYDSIIQQADDENVQAYCLLQIGTLRQVTSKNNQANLLAAISTYRQLIDEHPSSRYTRSAEKHLQDLQAAALEDL